MASAQSTSASLHLVNPDDRPRPRRLHGALADIGVPLSEFLIGDPDPEPVGGPYLGFEGYTTLLCGREGEGKSTVAAQLAAAVTRCAFSASWLDLESAPDEHGEAVVWIYGDDRLEQVAHAVAQGGGWPELVTVFPASAVESPMVLQEIVRQVSPMVIIVDPIFDLLRPEDDRSYREARELMAKWRTQPPVTTTVDADGIERDLIGVAPATIYLHHAPKDAGGRGGGRDSIMQFIGSTGLTSAVDVAVALEHRGKLDATERTLTICKSRVNAMPRGTVAWLDFDPATRRYREVDPPEPKGASAVAKADAKLQERAEAWIADHPGGSLRQLAAALGVTRGGGRRYDVLRTIRAAAV